MPVSQLRVQDGVCSSSRAVVFSQVMEEVTVLYYVEQLGAHCGRGVQGLPGPGRGGRAGEEVVRVGGRSC